jgi:Na+(H+)/acetate symporter ActP
MMDWEDAIGGSGSEDESDDMMHLHKAVNNLRDTTNTSSHASMRGLQLAVTEGWLITRARDMCSFAHDRYRQAAQAEAATLPQDVIAKMSFRVRALLCTRLTSLREF